MPICIAALGFFVKKKKKNFHYQSAGLRFGQSSPSRAFVVLLRPFLGFFLGRQCESLDGLSPYIKVPLGHLLVETCFPSHLMGLIFRVLGSVSLIGINCLPNLKGFVFES